MSIMANWFYNDEPRATESEGQFRSENGIQLSTMTIQFDIFKNSNECLARSMPSSKNFGMADPVLGVLSSKGDYPQPNEFSEFIMVAPIDSDRVQKTRSSMLP